MQGASLGDPMTLRMHTSYLLFVPDIEVQLCYAEGDDRRYD